MVLEAETIRRLNELIRGMVNFCIETYKKGESVDVKDLEALARLVEAVNSGGVEKTEAIKEIGFVVSGQECENMEDFGEYLRELRKEKGLTLTQLSEISGVSHPYISQIENDKFKPSPDILKKLAGPLGVPYTELLHKAGILPGDDG